MVWPIIGLMMGMLLSSGRPLRWASGSSRELVFCCSSSRSSLRCIFNSRSLPQAASTNVARVCISSFRAAWNNGFRRCQSSGVIFRFTSIIAGRMELPRNEAARVGVHCLVDPRPYHLCRSFQGCGSAKWSLKSFCHAVMDRLIVGSPST
jgi:hypothetical protein